MKNKKKMSWQTKRKMHAWVFVAPFLIGFIAFFAVPLLNTFYYSMNKVSVGDQGGMTFEWVGVTNYFDLFQSEVTTDSQPVARLFAEENTNLLISVPLIVIFSLFMALLANRKFKGRSVVRLLFFLPIILGIDVVVDMLTMTTGAATVDTSGVLLGGSYIMRFFMRNLNVSSDILIPIMIYIENIFELISKAGVQTLVYLTALQSISPSLYEVAKMEGATTYETFWKVTIPSIIHITFFVVIYTIVDIFLSSSIAEEAYAFAFRQGNIGVGSALSVVYMFNVLLVLGVVTLLLGKVVKKNAK